MTKLSLTDLEAAALAWLADSNFAQAPQPVRVDTGELLIAYWHTNYACNGVLVVVDHLSNDDLSRLIAVVEHHNDIHSKHDEMRRNIYGLPPRAAICVPGAQLNSDLLAAYLRIAATFNEPLMAAVSDSGTWVFETASNLLGSSEINLTTCPLCLGSGVYQEDDQTPCIVCGGKGMINPRGKSSVSTAYGETK